MTTSALRGTAAPFLGRQMLNKVPEVTLFFWIIKILCTTVGETAADFLNVNLGFGLTNTTYMMGTLLLATLGWQFQGQAVRPGRLLARSRADQHRRHTDHRQPDRQLRNLARDHHDRLQAVALAATFAAWFASERTLSIHTIVTRRREGFYWLAILFTFALGTAAGDLTAGKLSVGYWPSAVMFGAVIAIVAVAHFRFRLNAVLALWIAYILTRPLGASIGDFLSQARSNGDLGLGTTGTSALFLTAILGLVSYLAVTRRDVAAVERAPA
jgi:uncharacterized membrane-anchored protein